MSSPATTTTPTRFRPISEAPTGAVVKSSGSLSTEGGTMHTALFVAAVSMSAAGWVALAIIAVRFAVLVLRSDDHV